jgi:Domain of unknown function (DUF1905)
VDLRFSGEIWYWRGPAPFYFVTVPDPESAALESASPLVSYGWGMIPAAAEIGRTRWRTSLWPRDGGYVVPVKAAVRKSEQVDAGDTVTLRLTVDV